MHSRSLMASRSTTSGSCSLCGHRTSKTKMAAHLSTCASAHDRPGPSRAVTMVRIGAAHDPRYWLVVEMRSDATLKALDAFLRDIWVECCGHLRAFFIGRREVPMATLAGNALGSGDPAFRYEYDFGSTTELVGEAVGTRSGAIGRAPVRLLARNDSLGLPCASCAEMATNVCPYCLGDDDFLFCDAHAAAHEHAREEVYLPVVNSPRMGVCGYNG